MYTTATVFQYSSICGMVLTITKKKDSSLIFLKEKNELSKQ